MDFAKPGFKSDQIQDEVFFIVAKGNGLIFELCYVFFRLVWTPEPAALTKTWGHSRLRHIATLATNDRRSGFYFPSYCRLYLVPVFGLIVSCFYRLRRIPLVPVLWIRDPGGKKWPTKKKKKVNKFHFVKCLRAEGFSRSFDVPWGGLGISKLQFLI